MMDICLGKKIGARLPLELSRCHATIFTFLVSFRSLITEQQFRRSTGEFFFGEGGHQEKGHLCIDSRTTGQGWAFFSLRFFFSFLWVGLG